MWRLSKLYSLQAGSETQHPQEPRDSADPCTGPTNFTRGPGPCRAAPSPAHPGCQGFVKEISRSSVIFCTAHGLPRPGHRLLGRRRRVGPSSQHPSTPPHLSPWAREAPLPFHKQVVSTGLSLLPFLRGDCHSPPPTRATHHSRLKSSSFLAPGRYFLSAPGGHDGPGCVIRCPWGQVSPLLFPPSWVASRLAGGPQRSSG